METNRTTTQANRVADVSDALDEMPEGVSHSVFTDAERIYREDNVSFLVAFERAIEKNR